MGDDLTDPAAKPDISVVVPVYRSRDSLTLLVERLEPILSEHCGQFELVLVNDGSPDDSWSMIRALSAGKSWVRGLNMMRNYGQHNALLCGIRAARYPLIITMDDDLQHPPEELPKLIGALNDDFDVVYGYPPVEQHGFFRNIASVITKMALQQAMGATTARRVSALRIFRAHLRDAFSRYNAPFVSIDVLLTWGTTRFGSIPIRHDLRPIGKSGYTIQKLVTHAFNMMTGFTVIPLQLASYVGIASAMLGVVILIYLAIRYLLNQITVPGFTFLAASIAIFSGAQLLSLGVIGEYLARMHFRTMDKPAYVVKEESQNEPMRNTSER